MSDFPSNFAKDRVIRRRIAEHHAKWRSIRALRNRMTADELEAEEVRLAVEAKAFLARRDAETSAPN